MDENRKCVESQEDTANDFEESRCSNLLQSSCENSAEIFENVEEKEEKQTLHHHKLEISFEESKDIPGMLA